jgi:NAD(P)-dependent dehydrogenase (short-subunit alcohol dehydrogenase family)
MPVMRLEGKVALITGAGSGIGQATARLFAKEGAKVVVVDIDGRGGEETARLIEISGGEATFVRADVSKSAEAEKMVKLAVETYGRLDILHNNAGISQVGTVVDTPEEVWDKTINVNLKGIFLGSKYAIPEMLKTGGGIIVNTASVWGLVSAPASAAYCASKGAVIALTKAMALDHAPNIRVNCICPGDILTPMTERDLAARGDPEKALKAMTEPYPIGRLGKPEEIAEAALFLASDSSSFMTGAALIVDGGWTSTKKSTSQLR